jgi:hypothetical protein
VDVRLDPGVIGYAPPRIGTPNENEEVQIDTVQLAAFVSEAVDSTVAHEMGHAVGVHHHGAWEVGTCGARADKKLVAIWRGAHGGDQQCVMAYAGADYYKPEDRRCREFVWPSAWGGSFCRSKAGTGINAGPPRLVASGLPLPVSGDASRGDCAHQIRLK